MKNAKLLMKWLCRDKEILEGSKEVLKQDDTDNQNIIVSSSEELICDNTNLQKMMDNAATGF